MRRSKENPILTSVDIPAVRPELTDVSSVFNPGAIKSGEDTILVLRVQNRGRETLLLRAQSKDGIHFRVLPEPVEISGLERLKTPIYHAYDPRITVIANKIYVTLSLDLDIGSRTALFSSEDLSELNFIDLMWDGDSRNAVLFPEKINGRYLGLVRPNRISADPQVSSGSEIWLIESIDLQDWQPVKAIMSGRLHYWDELIGSGPPPIKTRSGWLHIYHGVATHFASVNIYQAGVCLLELDDPSKMKARGKYNIFEPRADYELVGQVPNVVFPSGMIVEDYDSEGFARHDSRVMVYYGAADTSVAAAETTIGELLNHCQTESGN
ncbi:MAG: hypothetical protein GY841_15240 [FCB group bacterium]|nr:hypothetical protein [FCB group bacterium]